MPHETDVAIVGGGLAGSLAAAMLGHAGIRALLIDPHPVYPPDFRCEKLDGTQVAILRKTPVHAAVLRQAAYDGEAWVAHYGRVLDRRRGDQHGIMYDTLVNTIRAQIPAEVPMLTAKVARIEPGAAQQRITLSTGETVQARLAVIATGLSVGLMDQLRLRREVFSACHSVSVGFDIERARRPDGTLPSLTYYAHRPAERMAYVTLFPVADTTRVNVFGYRDLHDPELRRFRHAPTETLCAMMPRLRAIIGDFAVTSAVQIRSVDLYRMHGARQPGFVLIGDAFSTSCPAAGTGARKALNDAERLCNHLIPQWLATPGMGADKIAAFYDDPEKRTVDDVSLAKAYSLRALCTETTPSARLERAARAGIRAAYGVRHAGERAGRRLRGAGATPDAASLRYGVSGTDAAPTRPR